MSLNIKNPRVHALAREAAKRTGQNQTSVIETALQRLLDELDREAERESHRQLLDTMQKEILAGPPLTDSSELFDDLTGLPR